MIGSTTKEKLYGDVYRVIPEFLKEETIKMTR